MALIYGTPSVPCRASLNCTARATTPVYFHHHDKNQNPLLLRGNQGRSELTEYLSGQY